MEKDPIPKMQQLIDYLIANRWLVIKVPKWQDYSDEEPRRTCYKDWIHNWWEYVYYYEISYNDLIFWNNSNFMDILERKQDEQFWLCPDRITIETRWHNNAWLWQSRRDQYWKQSKAYHMAFLALLCRDDGLRSNESRIHYILRNQTILNLNISRWTQLDYVKI